MKNRYLLLLSLLLATGVVRAQGVHFEKKMSWAQALEKARAEKKLIFVDVYATWCGPCKMLDQQTFPEARVGRYFNGHFINLKIDGEHGEGPGLMRTYNLSAYPSGLFINGDGQLVHEHVGFANAEEYLSQAENAFGRTGEGTIIKLMALKIKAGESNPALMRAYFKARRRFGDDFSPELETWFAKASPDSLQRPSYQQVLIENTQRLDGKAFAWLLANRQQQPRCGYKAQSVLKQQFEEAAETRNEKLFDKVLATVDQLAPNPDAAAEQKSELQTAYYLHLKKWDKYAKAATQHAEAYLMKDISEATRRTDSARCQACIDKLYQLAWDHYSNLKDKSELERALVWMRQICQTQPSAVSLSLNACLHYRLGHHDEAIKQQNDALQLAEKTGEDPAGYRETLDKIKLKKL